MSDKTVYIFGIILSIQAEIEGMKAENSVRKIKGESLAYDEAAFYEKAAEIRALSDQIY